MSWVPPDRPAGGPPEPPEGASVPPQPGGARQAWPPPGGQPAPIRPPSAPPTWVEPARGGGWPSGEGPSERPAGGPPPRRRSTPVILVAAVVLVLSAGFATFLLLRSDGGADPAAAPVTTGTTEPSPETTRSTAEPEEEPAAPPALSELEETVARLSQHVAEARGAPFPEAVTVELLDGPAFNERLLADFEEEREDIELVGRLFVAMGLLEPDQDLYQLFRDFLGVGVLGFYDPESGELVVRGAAITPYTESTIVHELVHAHDDQRFELHRPAIDDATDESAIGFSALVEGDAVRIQEAWEEELSAEDRESLRAEQLRSVAGVELGDVPLVLLQQIDFPYSAGPALVDALVDAGGEERVDAAFADPPTTSEQVIHPERYLEGEEPLPVPAPPADGDVIDAGAYGQLTLLITLGAVLDGETAREAAEGWGGDAYVAWQEGDATCVRSSFRMDTPEDLAELDIAWRAWAEEQPAADVTTGGDLVTVTACG